MRKTLLSIALAAAGGVATAAPIVVVASDNFDSYNVGALGGATGGTGFSGGWTGSSSASIQATNATDSPMTGNALQFTRPQSATAATRQLSQAIDTDVFVAFHFQFNTGAINNNDFMALWFGSATGPNIGLKANCGDGTGPGNTPCTADLFARTSGIDGAFRQNIEVGTTYRMLGFLQKVNGSSVYNRYSLWVGDDLAADTSTLRAADVVFDLGPSNVSSFSTIGFRVDNLDGSPSDSLLVDNLRLAQVVPEPGALALVGLGLLGVAASRRRRA